jgi:hypothetical protein
MSTITRNLKCLLNREEVETRAARMADVESDLRQIEEHRKSVVADLNGRKKALDAELASLGRQVREHAEYRDVECTMEPDYGAGIMETIRLDTGERIDVRKLYDSEMQPELPLKVAEESPEGRQDVAKESPGLAQIEAQEAARTGVAGPLTLPEAAAALFDAPPLADPAAG